jgi:hypothetical protein
MRDCDWLEYPRVEHDQLLLAYVVHSHRGEPVVAVVADTLGDGQPAAPSQLQAAPIQVGVTEPPKFSLREKPRRVLKARTADTSFDVSCSGSCTL